MATPILDQIHLDLAYKLQDPVATAGASGVRITAGERERYILRGYRRLLRTVTLLYPKLIAKIYHKFYKTVTAITTTAGEYVLKDESDASPLYIIEVFEVLSKEPAQETFVRAYPVGPDNWLSVQQGINTFYTPDLNDRQYYWTVENGRLIMMPTVKFNLKMKIRDDIASKIEDGIGDDLDLIPEYSDLLLSLACMEAYLDIGQPDMAKAYNGDVINQLQILTAQTQRMDMKDED